MSEALHIHGHPLSQPTRAILIFSKLSGVAHDFHLVDLMKRDHLTEEFTRINPYQAVPAIVHGTYSLWESPAIVTYIADAFDVDNQWYPKDIKIRGRINAYFHWHHQGCREPIAGYLRAKIIGPKFFGAPELTPEQEVPLRAKFDEFFSTFKWVLSDTGFAARTATATIADIFAYCEIAQTIMMGLDLAAFPEVKAWYDRIGECAIVTEVHETLRNMVASFHAQAAPQ